MGGGLARAKFALKLGAGEEFRYFWLARRHQERQPIKRAGESLTIDHLLAALAVPTCDLQVRIVEGAHEAEAIARPPARAGREIESRNQPELARDRFRRPQRIRSAQFDRACGDFAGRVLEMLEFGAGPVNFEHEVRTCARGVTPGHDVLAAASWMATNGIIRFGFREFRNGPAQTRGRGARLRSKPSGPILRRPPRPACRRNSPRRRGSRQGRPRRRTRARRSRSTRRRTCAGPDARIDPKALSLWAFSPRSACSPVTVAVCAGVNLL